MCEAQQLLAKGEAFMNGTGRSEEAKAYRHWYKRKVWKLLRSAHVVAHPFCALCLALGIEKLVEVVDHIVPHRGDWSLFIDPDNLQSLCEDCHAKLKQQVERRGYHEAVGTDGWPVDPAHPANAGWSPHPGGSQNL